MADWQPDEYGLQDCDEVGDDQAGTVYSIRFRRPPINGVYPMVTVGFYNQDQWQMGGNSAEPEDACLTDPPPARERYKIGQWVRFERCTDPENPGDTAEWEDNFYRESWFSRAEPFTDAQIKALMENFKPEWIYWDGALDLRGYIAVATAVEPVDPQDWDATILTPELKAIVAGIMREIDWFSEDGLYNDQWLKAEFEFEYCAECGLDADAHTVGPDMFGKRHIWCKIGLNPAFAIKIARENRELGPQLPGQLFYPEADDRRMQFEAAWDALREQGLVDADVPDWKKQWDRNWGADVNENARARIIEALDNAEEIIRRRAERTSA